MSDSYQAVYDAVRSCFRGDFSGAVRDAAERHFDISHSVEILRGDISYNVAVVQEAMTRPSVLYRPTLSADGTMWSVLLGSNIQEGVCGFGETPEAAMADFDKNFREERTPTARRLAGAPS